MSTSPILGLTLMTASQAQKEVVFNEFLIAMDALFRGSVLDGSLHIPPSAPAEGDAYIINTGATGLWSGYDNQIAFYFNGWQFVSPPTKITLFDVAANQFYQFQGGTLLGMTFLWDAVPVSTVTVLNDLADVSITSPTNGEVMTYNSSTSKWNAMAAAFTATLASLTDVEVTEGSAIDGFVLYWKDADSKWEAKALAAPPTFLTLPDVSLTGVANGFLLEYTTTGPGVKFVDPLSLVLVASLANVGDVTYGSGLTVGDVLQWNGAAWAPVILSTLTLAGLSDVLVTEGSGIDGCVLTWNNTAGKWVPDVPATGGATTLAGLTDVNVTEGSGLNGKVLYWKNADAKWEAEAIAAVALSGAYSDLSGTPSIPGNSSFNLSGLGDVTLTSLTNGQVLEWNSTASKWENVTPSSGGGGGGGSSTLAGDSDVTITSPANGQVLTYNSGASAWENATPSGGGGGGSVLSPPLISALGAVSHNPNSDTFTQRTSGAIPCLVMRPSGGDGNSEIFCELMANPQGSGQFSLVTKISLDPGDVSGGYHGAGLVIYNSANGTSYAYWTSCNGGASYSTFFATVASLGAGPSASASGNYQNDCFHHIDYDGTDIKFGLSKNGVDVNWNASIAISTFIGAVTHVGIGWGNFSSGCVLQWQHFFCGARGSSGIVVT